MKLFFLAIISVCGIFKSHFLLDENRKQSIKPLISPPPYMKYYSLGYNEVLSDIMWMRTIQDLDYCESKVKENITDNTLPCKGNAWLYNMLDALTDLSPNFRMPFAIGGVALKYLIGDSQSASLFYDKATLRFPKDWKILFGAAHHAMDVEKDLTKAARLLKASADNGGADWYYALAAKLYTEAGQKEFGILLYEDVKRSGILTESMLDKMKKNLGM
jgi:hypothetical protein